MSSVAYLLKNTFVACLSVCRPCWCCVDCPCVLSLLLLRLLLALSMLPLFWLCF